MKKTIDNLGRIVIPKSCRKELGIAPGEEVNLDFENGKIVISKIQQGITPEERIDKAIELLSKGITFCENDSLGVYDVCRIAINREKKILSILKRGKDE